MIHVMKLSGGGDVEQAKANNHPSFLFSSTIENFVDPLCKLNLKETSDFVRAFPMSSGERRRSSVELRRTDAAAAMAAPCTPGRPVFNFRKSVPSKWDDAEKWIISGGGGGNFFHDSPAHGVVKKGSTQNATTFKHNLESNGASSQVLLKDKFMENVEPTKEGFLFGTPLDEATKEFAAEPQSRDVGTEMTPLGSSTTSRCHTPIKDSSPARHNTPADRSGPLTNPNDISSLKQCHFAKLDLGAQFDSVASNWSSREEEEEEVSKSLRHFEASKGRKSIGDDSRAATWEDGERTKSCIRYQREEARIQAWVNLQKAKAEARSRKLEVKIQKMRSDMEEKQMKRMAVVHRRAEEWRASAQLQHSQQVLRASQQALKMQAQHRSLHKDCTTSCGCFPCNHL